MFVRLAENCVRGALQLEIQDRVSTLADLKEQIEEKHRQLEKQLMQQLDVQELLRYTPHCPMLRYIVPSASLNLISDMLASLATGESTDFMKQMVDIKDRRVLYATQG